MLPEPSDAATLSIDRNDDLELEIFQYHILITRNSTYQRFDRVQ